MMKNIFVFLMSFLVLASDGLDEKIHSPQTYFSDERRTWVGREIYLLPRKHGPGENPFFDFCTDPRDQHDTRLGYRDLAGKTGHFLEVWQAHITYHDWMRVFHYVQGYFWKVRLDSSGRIVWYWDDNQTGVMNFGFVDDFNAARRHIGDTLYVKSEPCLYGLDDSTAIPLRNAEPVVIRKVEWGEFGNCPIKIILERSNGQIGYLWAWKIEKFLKNWYKTNPRKRFHVWNPKFWRYILYRRLVPGMTQEMVRLSWGEPDRRETFISTSGDTQIVWIYPGVRHVEYLLYFLKNSLRTWKWQPSGKTEVDLELKPLHLEESP